MYRGGAADRLDGGVGWRIRPHRPLSVDLPRSRGCDLGKSALYGTNYIYAARRNLAYAGIKDTGAVRLVSGITGAVGSWIKSEAGICTPVS